MTAALEGDEWSAARPGRTLPPGKDPVPILQEAGWAPGPVWTGGKSRPHRDSIPNRPARSQSLYRLSYPAHPFMDTIKNNNRKVCRDYGKTISFITEKHVAIKLQATDPRKKSVFFHQNQKYGH